MPDSDPPGFKEEAQSPSRGRRRPAQAPECRRGCPVRILGCKKEAPGPGPGFRREWMFGPGRAPELFSVTDHTSRSLGEYVKTPL